MTIKERVLKVVCEQLGKDPATVKDTDHLGEDHGADDFDYTIIWENLETEFHTRITEDEWAGCGSVEDIVKLIQNIKSR